MWLQNRRESMYKTNIFIIRTIIYLICLISTNISECWTVKIINFTNEKITVDIKSSQVYPSWNKKLTKRRCEFIGKQINPNSTRDFNYKEINSICVAPCTKSVTITSPIKLSSQSKLTSCSNVIVVIRKDQSNKWRIEYHDWTNDILNILKEREKMPLEVRKIYDQLGDSPIQEISVFRQPISSGIKKLMKIVTKNELKQLHYDELYHTGFIIKCQDLLVKLERNETVSSSIQIIKAEDKKNIQIRNISIPRKTIRYNEFINNAMEGDPDFWRYHPITNNCQLFVLQCLEKNNLEVSNNLYKFIYQDIEQVLSNSPILRNLSIASTSLANRVGKIIEGISNVTIQNGTPYTIRVKTRYAGQSKLLKICIPDDFLLESGKEKTVSHGICLLEGIKIAASSKGIETIKNVPHEQLQQAANMFAESSFVGRGKASANFLIRFVNGTITIENIAVSRAELKELTTIARKRTIPAPA